MGTWRFKFLFVGIAFNDEGSFLVDMGMKHWVAWKQIRGVFYIKWKNVDHDGKFWKDVRIEKYR